MVPCKSAAEEVSFEWSHHRISSTDLKVRTTLHVSITDSGGERVDGLLSPARDHSGENIPPGLSECTDRAK